MLRFKPALAALLLLASTVHAQGLSTNMGDSMLARGTGATLKIEARGNIPVVDKDLNTPPGSPATGAWYIAGASPTGAWSGHALDLLRWDGAAYQFFDPVEGNTASVNDEDLIYRYSGSAWVAIACGSAATAATVSDEAITIAKLADGTDGELITWDSSGEATTVAVGTAGQVLTSNGPGAAPTFEDATGGGGGSYTDEEAQDAVGTILTDSASIDFTYTDATPAITAIVINDSVTDSKIRNSGPLSVIGRSANSTGDPTDIQASDASGAVLRESGSTLGFGTVATAGIADDAITYAKLQNISATDRLLCRDTAAAGNAEECTVTGGVEFTGSTGIQRSALTGDVTASAGSNSTTIANDAVTYAKMQNVSATDRLLGRDTASAGDTEELTCSGGIEFTGSGGIQTSAFTGDVTKTAGGTALTIAADAVTSAKIQDGVVALADMANLAQDQFIGRTTASTGVPQTATITSFSRTYLDDTDAASVRNTLGIGALRTFRPIAPYIGGTLASTSGRIYATFVGCLEQSRTIKFVTFPITVVGVGTQAAEVGLASSPVAANKSAQTLTVLASDGTVDTLTTGTGLKRNTTAFNAGSGYVVASGTCLWTLVRVAMQTTQPTYAAAGGDFGQSNVLWSSTDALGAITGLSTITTINHTAGITGPAAPMASAESD